MSGHNTSGGSRDTAGKKGGRKSGPSSLDASKPVKPRAGKKQAAGKKQSSVPKGGRSDATWGKKRG